jgi:hypothetical protein
MFYNFYEFLTPFGMTGVLSYREKDGGEGFALAPILL